MSGYPPSSDIAFTPSVKAVQQRKGSRDVYAAMEAQGGFRTLIDDRLRMALAIADSAYLVTASADAQPYAQHRGGPPGFIRVMDEHTLGFADFSGNRQYITAGNLAENPRAFLFVMDYAERRRVKIWGRARMVDNDPELCLRLMPAGYGAKPEAALMFEVDAWDLNCPQHIPRKFGAAQVTAVLAERDARIAALEAELSRLKGEIS
ncbi:pyridoxamine 5'-phosphate oxidase family protein [Novosphingobium sp.]|uniref:pyridoxamine 5'-phosphate oxidase family protein n=1 Tax=Novosphingobium sp. TaxID=1874826 RepID=UPI0026244203|nr:pyridoxamine 5'-phosphate oxidase family protein [Novosphingobium sp.]